MEEKDFKEKKQKANEFGDFAEELACQEYIKNGYTILERNWRLGKTEIDIIARKDDLIILIEVKARSGKDEDAISAVTSDKRRRMVRAADSYIKKQVGSYDYRFDIVACTGNIKNYDLEIVEDAFLAADLF